MATRSLPQTSPASSKAVDSWLPATSIGLEEPKDSDQLYSFIYFNLLLQTIVYISDIIGNSIYYGLLSCILSSFSLGLHWCPFKKVVSLHLSQNHGEEPPKYAIQGRPTRGKVPTIHQGLPLLHHQEELSPPPLQHQPLHLQGLCRERSVQRLCLCIKTNLLPWKVPLVPPNLHLQSNLHPHLSIYKDYRPTLVSLCRPSYRK